MKYFLVLAGVLGMFILGYILEPTMRVALTSEAPEPDVRAPANDLVIVEPEPTNDAPEATPEEPELAVVEPETPPPPTESTSIEPEPEPAGEIEVVAAPEEPKPAEPVGIPVANAEDLQIRQLMHQSLQNGEIDHFAVNQVIRVTEVGQEVINGIQYQFGILEYRDNTVFGQKEFEAKALIRDGKVERWIWPANGMRIP